MYVMKKANGDIFQIMIGGKDRVVIWRNELAAIRFKAANPELLVFLPSSVETPSVRAALKKMESSGQLRF